MDVFELDEHLTAILWSSKKVSPPIEQGILCIIRVELIIGDYVSSSLCIKEMSFGDRFLRQYTRANLN